MTFEIDQDLELLARRAILAKSLKIGKRDERIFSSVMRNLTNQTVDTIFDENRWVLDQPNSQRVKAIAYAVISTFDGAFKATLQVKGPDMGFIFFYDFNQGVRSVLFPLVFAETDLHEDFIKDGVVEINEYLGGRLTVDDFLSVSGDLRHKSDRYKKLFEEDPSGHRLLNETLKTIAYSKNRTDLAMVNPYSYHPFLVAGAQAGADAYRKLHRG